MVKAKTNRDWTSPIHDVIATYKIATHQTFDKIALQKRENAKLSTAYTVRTGRPQKNAILPFSQYFFQTA